MRPESDILKVSFSRCKASKLYFRKFVSRILLQYLRQLNVKLISLLMQNHKSLLIIDFGSQVTQLIARRLRELSVYCEIQPFQNVSLEFLKKFNADAIILSGGPASVIEKNHQSHPN